MFVYLTGYVEEQINAFDNAVSTAEQQRKLSVTVITAATTLGSTA